MSPLQVDTSSPNVLSLRFSSTFPNASSLQLIKPGAKDKLIDSVVATWALQVWMCVKCGGVRLLFGHSAVIPSDMQCSLQQKHDFACLCFPVLQPCPSFLPQYHQDLAHLKHLTSIDLEHSTAIGAAGMAALALACTRLETLTLPQVGMQAWAISTMRGHTLMHVRVWFTYKRGHHCVCSECLCMHVDMCAAYYFQSAEQHMFIQLGLSCMPHWPTCLPKF